MALEYLVKNIIEDLFAAVIVDAVYSRLQPSALPCTASRPPASRINKLVGGKFKDRKREMKLRVGPINEGRR